MNCDYGDPRLPDEFWEKVSPEPNSGCWIWMGNLSRHPAGDRGSLIRNGRQVFAHRHAYAALVAPLSRHRSLEQTCGVTECCNPSHCRFRNQLRDEETERKREHRRRIARRASPIAKRARRSAILKSSYGITIDDYEAMVAKQNNRCAICSVTFEVGGDSRKRPCIDHCHRSGDVRGILCSNCNTGIGYFADNPTVLKAAVDYTQSFAQREIAFRVKKPQTITCLKCGVQGHNSRTCKQAAVL